ncbi:MAG: histidine phosphatase family protein [Bacteroidia bacterium]|nr:histidine phosphatase family protein [Bacteroidia bacterium]
MLSLYLIRHAESLGNVNHHLVGGQSNHYALSERGEQQSHLLGQRFATEGLTFDALYSSTAVRTQSTAQISCSYLPNVPDLRLRPELLELSQGDWEGKVRTEIYTPEQLTIVRADPYDFRPPNGESQRDVEARMYRWLEGVAATHGQSEQPTVVGAYTHGFAIKTLLRGLMQSTPTMTYRTIIHNTSLTVLYYERGLWYIDRVNDYQHIIGTEFIGHY